MTENNDLFLTYKEEYREALEHCNQALLMLVSDPDDGVSLKSASRQLQHIKGFANRMRAPRLGQLAHIVEDVLEGVDSGRLTFDEDLADILFKGMDLFVHYLRARDIPSEETAKFLNQIEPLVFIAMDEESAEREMEALLPDFVASARDNVEGMSRGLACLEKDSSDTDVLQEVYRHAHSLKGSSLTMGFKRMGRLAHRMEDVLRSLQKGQLRVTRKVCAALFEANDALSVMLDTLAVGKRMKVGAADRVAGLSDLVNGFKHENKVRELEPAKGAVQERAAKEPSVETVPTIPPMDTVRVHTAKLDELANLASEAFIAQNRLTHRIDALVRICDRWQRVRQEVETSLHLAEAWTKGEMSSISEIVEIGDSLGEAGRRLQEAAEDSGRHIEALQHHSMRIRLLPLALVFNTLPRVVRNLSRQFGKQVNFEMEGAKTTIDKRMLEQIGDPLIHLLRNALVHGIEAPDVRRQSGKPGTGTIYLQARQERGKVLLTLKDDGLGIDPQRLKQVAIDNGFVSQSEIAGWTATQLLELIFLPGFSTSARVTDVSGRGLGMDVVRTNIERLKGQVEIFSEFGTGSTVIMSLPLTLATMNALMIRCGGDILAIPSSSVERALHVCKSAIAPFGSEDAILHQGQLLPVRNLAADLGWDERNRDPLEPGRATLVVLQSGDRRTGFVVDDILGQEEIVTKTLGSHLQEVSFAAGATILGTGEVALILDVPHLLRQEQGARGKRTAGSRQ